MRFASQLALGVWFLALVGCKPSTSTDTTPPESGASAGASEGDAEASAAEEGTNAIVGRELPGELVAELRLQGADENGRLMTLAPSFVATAECSDCGAPSYLRILAVRCADEYHCDVLTEACEGSIAREGDVYELEFHVVEAPEGEDPCAGYSGTFELP